MGILIANFLSANFLSILMIFCLLYLSLTDRGLEVETRNSLYGVVVCVCLLLISTYLDSTIQDNLLLDVWAGIAPYVKVRTVAAAVGYALRPLLLVFSVCLLYSPGKIVRQILSVAAGLNAVISLASIGTGWVFTIDEENLFHSGPLRYANFAVSFGMLFLLLGFMFVRWKQYSNREHIAVLFAVGAVLISSVLDIVDGENPTLMQTIVCAFFMYYLCLYTNRSNQVIRRQDEKLEEQRTDLLMAQIQPRFIYSTLNVISDLCARDVEKTRETIRSFSLYLRGNLNLKSSKEPVPVEDELEHTRFYTDIVKVRYPNLKINFDVNDGGYDVPFLILQPVLEYAITGGGKSAVTLWIVLDEEQGKNNARYHVIRVRDNNRTKPAEDDPEGASGLALARSRVEKAGGRFEVEYVEKHGTVITIRFPVEAQREEDF